MPLHKYRDLAPQSHVRIDAITEVTRLHVALNEVHKTVSAGNTRRRTQAQKIHNARTNVTPITLHIDDYVMVRTDVQRKHKVQSIWRGPMRVIESKSDLVFKVEDIINAEQHTVHAQRIVSYPVTQQGAEASNELLEQAAHFDKKYHLVDSIAGVQKRSGTYEVRIRWAGYENTKEDT